MSALDNQVGGSHYNKMAIQLIKYVARFRDKNGIEDLKKAIHTIELLIEFEELKNDPARSSI